MEPDDVTLVVPCYDVADTLPSVLSAIDGLDPAPARVLCVDDGSTDGTRSIVEAHDGVDLVAHSRNRGLGTTLNTALERTNTPGLAKIDADILVDPDWLGTLCAVIAARDVALVQGRFEERVTTMADEWRAKHPSPHFPDRPMANTPINGSNILCRVKPLRDVGGWDDQFKRAFDDIDLFLRLIDAGHWIYYSPDVVTTHIRTDTWREVLRTAWAYHYDVLTGRENPEHIRDVAFRFPVLLYRSGRGIAQDISNGDFALLWISLLRPFYHVKWDLETVRRRRG